MLLTSRIISQTTVNIIKSQSSSLKLGVLGVSEKNDKITPI